jgi:di/tricarboxylate transporter
MTWEIVFVLCMLAASFVAMVWEKWSVDIVALAAMALLLVVLTPRGVLTPRDIFSVFANEATITIACMFVLSAGLESTGAIEIMGQKLSAMGLKTETSLLLVTLPLVGLISAFVNNTPVVVVFMPIMISIAAKHGIKPSKLLIPLSFAAIFGGSCTLIGTSTNILVSATAEANNQDPIGMFELTPVGLVIGAAGLVYMMTIGRKLLPDRETLSSILQTTESREYLTEAVVAADSPLIGKLVSESSLKNLKNSRILDVTRNGEMLTMPLDKIVLEEGDRLRITSILSGLLEMKEQQGLDMLPHSELGLQPLGTQKAAIMESVIGPNSELIGKSIRQVNFRQRFGILILAVHREGQNLQRKFENIRLNFGDTILMEGTESAIEKLRADRNFLFLTAPSAVATRRNRMWVAVGIVVVMVLLATLNVLPISALALICGLAMVLTGCLQIEEAYRAINWKIIVFILGTLSLGLALEKTGGAQVLAHGLIVGMGSAAPLAILAATFAISSLLTTFLSNNAVAVILTPIVIGAVAEVGLDPRPYVMAVAFGASASFATPVGYQTNTLVYGAGGYRFGDFVKVGLPLNILFWILATLLIPLFWSLEATPGLPE